MRWLIKSLLVLALLAGVVLTWAHFSMAAYMKQPLTLSEPTTFEIPTGATLRGVSRQLRERGISENTHWLLLRARLDKNAADIKAGRYTLAPGLSAEAFFELIRAGNVDLERLVIVEGWTVAQGLAAIVSHPAIVDDLDISIDQRADGVAWLSDDQLAALSARFGVSGDSLEGWLAPDTYRFAAGSTASDIVESGIGLMRARLDNAWSLGDPPTGIDTPYAALVLASIIEKETGLASERAQIAGVFVRRLAQPMRLQTDPTVIYGIGQRYDGDIRRADLQTPTPYNTYTIDGLPPTPIALPGEAALQSVMAPADGEALYFVASGKGDGSHVFSTTLEEHERAVQAYLKALRQRPQ
ncbi:MAG: endolytic transglycosylase MltG [Pseudomonadota bacterium]